MRTSLSLGTVVALVLIASTPLAQAKGKRQQQPSATSSEDAAKKKQLDADYNRALSSVPDAPAKQDPWKTLR